MLRWLRRRFMSRLGLFVVDALDDRDLAWEFHDREGHTIVICKEKDLAVILDGERISVFRFFGAIPLELRDYELREVQRSLHRLSSDILTAFAVLERQKEVSACP